MDRIAAGSPSCPHHIVAARVAAADAPRLRITLRALAPSWHALNDRKGAAGQTDTQRFGRGVKCFEGLGLCSRMERDRLSMCGGTLCCLLGQAALANGASPNGAITGIGTLPEKQIGGAG